MMLCVSLYYNVLICVVVWLCGCVVVWLCRLFGFVEYTETSRFGRSITRQLGRVVKALAC
jgi:hypothetical protein